jgi:phosphatidylglycerol lysyltransferase
MEMLLLRYGYALLFAGVLVEGEVVLLVAAILARRGVFAWPAVVLVAVAANTLADLAYFGLARRRGRGWLEARYGAHPRFRKLLDLVGRHGPLLLLASRFAYGLRIAIPAACGALGMGAAAFLATDLMAGLVWAATITALGYSVGGAVEPVLARLQGYEMAAAAGLLVAVAVGASAAFGVRHLRALAREGRLGAADLHRLVPRLIGFVGALNLATALWPRSADSMAALESWLPLEVMQRSRPLMLFSGLALLQVARSLARRKLLAHRVAALALGVSFVSHLGHGLSFHHSIVSGLLLAYLWGYRRRFQARADPQSARRALLMAPALVALVLVYGFVGLRSLEAQFEWDAGNSPFLEAARSGLLIDDAGVDPTTPLAARFLGSLEIAGWLARAYMLVMLLRPVIARTRLEAPAEVVEKAFRSWARYSLASFAVEGDKHHLLVAGGRGLVAYAVRGGVALAAGDPLASKEQMAESVHAYLEHCRSNGWIPCIYEASEETLPIYRAQGLRTFKMAEEAVIDLPSFSLAGGKRAALRAMVNKVVKQGVTVALYDRAAGLDAAKDAQLEEISREWLGSKRQGEMGFTVTRFSLEALDSVRVLVCRDGERIVAFCSWRPYRGDRAVVLDLMRKRHEAPSGAMDLLLTRSLEYLRDLGLEEASLANAPLANVNAPSGLPERAVALLFERMNGFYGYKSLFQFKKKFAPRWEGRYLVYPGRVDLPRVALAMASVHGSLGLRQLLLGR